VLRKCKQNTPATRARIKWEEKRLMIYGKIDKETVFFLFVRANIAGCDCICLQRHPISKKCLVGLFFNSPCLDRDDSWRYSWDRGPSEEFWTGKRKNMVAKIPHFSRGLLSCVLLRRAKQIRVKLYLPFWRRSFLAGNLGSELFCMIFSNNATRINNIWEIASREKL